MHPACESSLSSYDLPLSPGRTAAFDILRRVQGGAYASDLLAAKTESLPARDAGLATQIVFGCLRFQLQLDHIIGLLVPGKKLDIEVCIALRMGIYQVRYLDRIPAHAAVSESVELVKRARKRSAAGLVNAALRKVDRKPVAWPDRHTGLCCPQWLLDSWDRQFGAEVADTIAQAFLHPPETYVASTGRQQDIGSQAIVPLLELAPGQTFLDLCAGPGNKTAQALQHGVQAVACDLHLHRLTQVPENCRRVVLDGTAPLPFAHPFDRILVDAPCSGTGTLGRNPEIKWRIQPSDLIGLHEQQVKLLGNALRYLKRGGRLVYSTCSLEREENEDVVKEFPGPWQMSRRIPGVDAGDGFFTAVLALD